MILHLPYHIRRFGPALLYATETFESYNFVIRLRSIHSSKQAPSVDIARAFSHLHAVRHLVSGGHIFHAAGKPLRQAGTEILALQEDKEFLGYMLLSSLFDAEKIGRYSPLTRCEWRQTLASTVPGISTSFHGSTRMLTCASLVLKNGDLAEVHGHIVYDVNSVRRIGSIEEIVVSPAHNSLVGVVVRRWRIGEAVDPYGLPSCIPEADVDGCTLLDLVLFKVCSNDLLNITVSLFQHYRTAYVQ